MSFQMVYATAWLSIADFFPSWHWDDRRYAVWRNSESRPSVDSLPPGAKCVKNDADEAALAAFVEAIRVWRSNSRCRSFACVRPRLLAHDPKR